MLFGTLIGNFNFPSNFEQRALSPQGLPKPVNLIIQIDKGINRGLREGLNLYL
jgi:hypothetical protein